jgi:hypothetical protein
MPQGRVGDIVARLRRHFNRHLKQLPMLYAYSSKRAGAAGAGRRPRLRLARLVEIQSAALRHVASAMYDR